MRGFCLARVSTKAIVGHADAPRSPKLEIPVETALRVPSVAKPVFPYGPQKRTKESLEHFVAEQAGKQTPAPCRNQYYANACCRDDSIANARCINSCSSNLMYLTMLQCLHLLRQSALSLVKGIWDRKQEEKGALSRTCRRRSKAKDRSCHCAESNEAWIVKLARAKVSCTEKLSITSKSFGEHGTVE